MALTTLSIGRGSRQFPAPGWRLPIPRASWAPTIWPACRSEIGGWGLVRSLSPRRCFAFSLALRLLARIVLLALAVLSICGSVAGRMFVAGIRHQRHRPLVRCDTNLWERLPQPLFHLAARGLGHPKPSRNPRLPRCLSCERLDRRRQFATAHSGGQTAVKFLRRRNVSYGQKLVTA